MGFSHSVVIITTKRPLNAIESKFQSAPTMAALSPNDRIEEALSAPEPFQFLLSVAKQLRDEGMHQHELSELFDTFRARQENEADETRINAILDTLDFIVGWCSPGNALYQRSQIPKRISYQVWRNNRLFAQLARPNITSWDSTGFQ